MKMYLHAFLENKFLGEITLLSQNIISLTFHIRRKKKVPGVRGTLQNINGRNKYSCKDLAQDTSFCSCWIPATITVQMAFLEVQCAPTAINLR